VPHCTKKFVTLFESTQKKDEKPTTPIRSSSQKVSPIIPAPGPSTLNQRVNLRPEITSSKPPIQRSPLTTAQSVLVQELLTKLMGQVNKN